MKDDAIEHYQMFRDKLVVVISSQSISISGSQIRILLIKFSQEPIKQESNPLTLVMNYVVILYRLRFFDT